MPLKSRIVGGKSGNERVRRGENLTALYIRPKEKKLLQIALDLSPEIKLDGLNLHGVTKLKSTLICLESKFEGLSEYEETNLRYERLFRSVTVDLPEHFERSSLTVDPLEGEGRYRSTIHSSAGNSDFIPLRYKTHKSGTDTIPSVLFKSAILASLPKEVLLPVKNQENFLVVVSINEAGNTSLLLSWNNKRNVVEALEILPKDLKAVMQKTKSVFVLIDK